MQRDLRLDSIKGFLIILVVLGHLIGKCGRDDFVTQNVEIFIYSFHMPLFMGMRTKSWTQLENPHNVVLQRR